MKKGDVVFFITKGVVRSGIFIGRKYDTALIKYINGSHQKYYHHKICRVATELEGGINGRLSESSNTESNKGRNRRSSEVSKCRVPNSKGKNAGDKVFVGAWRICNMA